MYDEFVEGLVDYAENLEVGPGLEADIGPQVTAAERDGTLDYIEVGQDEGATLETGGGIPDVDSDGHYVEPTVFSDVETKMRIAQEEIFGPVIAVIPVADFEEALTVANDSQYGLSASIITENLTEANRFVDEVEAGVVKVNEKTTGLELHVPFGGTKNSSSETWREQGDAGLEFYTTTKTVYLNY
jgi:aldehyde dehydrogenase (NAD+)